MSRLAWLVGTWQAEFHPRGADKAAPAMTFEWGPRRSYLKMLGYRPAEGGGLAPEHDTVIFWNPVAGRFEFQGVYHDAGPAMFEDGHLELLEGGAVRLHMAVHYAEGEGLPFSDGAVSGRGGHTLEFRRTLSPDGDDGLRGTFVLKRGGRWENPHPELDMDFYPWRRSTEGADGGVPAWAREEMERLVRGSGRWLASNAEWADEEPADAYGLEWKWALGEQGVRGRLFGLADGREIGTYWELHTFWHPGERRLTAEQFSGTGVYATGTIRPTGGGELEIEQTIHAPDGTATRILHRSTVEEHRRRDRSFVWSEGEWQPRRAYVWELQPEP